MFSIIWRVRHSLLYPGLIEVTVNESAAMALVLGMSKEHYASSCGVLAALAAGVTESTLGDLLVGITGIKRNSKEGRLFRERSHAILKEMTGEGHLAGRVPPAMRREQEEEVDLVVVDLTPVEAFTFAIDCVEMSDDTPPATERLMEAIAKEVGELLTPAQKMAGSLSGDEPVRHDRSQ